MATTASHSIFGGGDIINFTQSYTFFSFSSFIPLYLEMEGEWVSAMRGCMCLVCHFLTFFDFAQICWVLDFFWIFF